MAAKQFTWLHLTDLQIGMSIEPTRWAYVESLVLDDLDKVTKRSGPIDVIFFTGDLTQKGLAKEFRTFDTILATIRERLRQHGSEPLFVAVPGNHDLHRPAETSAVVQALNGWATNTVIRQQMWTQPKSEYRRVVNTAFKDWTAWSERAIDWTRLEDVRRNGVLPGDFSASWMDGDRDLRVGILGLNTAALQLTAGNYEGRLTLNADQLYPLMDNPDEWARSHDVVFLLTHHDPTWLDAEALGEYRRKIAPVGRFPLHLCGHRHVAPAALKVQYGDDPPRRTYAGAALWGLDHFEGFGGPGGDMPREEQRVRGYTIGRIMFGKNRTMRQWPRRQEFGQSDQWVIGTERGQDVAVDEGTRDEKLGPSPTARGRPPRLPGTDRKVMGPRTVPGVAVAPTMTDEANSGWTVLQRRGSLHIVEERDGAFGRRPFGGRDRILRRLLPVGKPIAEAALSQDGRIMLAISGDRLLVADILGDLSIRPWEKDFDLPGTDCRILGAQRRGPAPDVLLTTGTSIFKGRFDRGGIREWKPFATQAVAVRIATALNHGFALLDSDGRLLTDPSQTWLPDVIGSGTWQDIDFAVGGGTAVVAAIGPPGGQDMRLVVTHHSWQPDPSTDQGGQSGSANPGRPIVTWIVGLTPSVERVEIARTPELGEAPRFVVVADGGTLRAWDLETPLSDEEHVHNSEAGLRR